MQEVHAVLSDIADPFVLVDDAWRFVFVNPAAETLWRSTAADMSGRSIFLSPDLALDRICQDACLPSKHEGVPIAFSVRSDRLDAWLEVRGYPLSAGYGLMLRDITEQRDAQREMAERDRAGRIVQSINQRVFEVSQDLLLVVDSQGNLLRVSPSAFSILGYRPEEMVGHSAIRFIYPDDLDSTRAEMRMARRGRLIRHFYCRYVHKSGRVVTLAWMGVWTEPEQQHIFAGRDMSEQIVAEERLRHSQRLEAIGQLTGGMAHDFNNMLTVIIGNLDVLHDTLKDNPDAEAFADMALKASMRGAELTHRLLAFARRQTLDAKIFDFNERVAATMGLLRRTLGEQVEIETVLAPDLWPAVADPAQFESALVNLSINARDAMPGGGRLIIETENQRIDEEDTRDNPDANPGAYAMLAVTDTGTGMAPEILSRVFEPFFTTKPQGEGTGLGLSMVYGFVRQSHGHMRIYSEPGIGTTVRLYLPRAPVGAALEPVAASSGLAVARPGECVLVVEDNPQVRKVVVVQLRALGYRVLEADGAPAALDLLQTGEAVDLLFSDVVMPGGMGGVELAQAGRALRPDLRVLLTSGFPGGAMQGRAEGLRNLLSKPYRQAELAARVRATLDGPV